VTAPANPDARRPEWVACALRAATPTAAVAAVAAVAHVATDGRADVLGGNRPDEDADALARVATEDAAGTGRA
jgi:hypothetical protein